jgi:hypothetical protein
VLNCPGNSIIFTARARADNEFDLIFGDLIEDRLPRLLLLVNERRI